MPSLRHLVLCFGDQLNRDAAVWDDFDPDCDRAWLCEADSEAEHVWSTKPRIAVFLSAMRHFAAALEGEGIPLTYHRLEVDSPARDLFEQLRADLDDLQPERVRCVLPGEWRVKAALEALCEQRGLPLDLLRDRHFYSSPRHFRDHAQGRKALRMEYFYRQMRREHGVLLDDAGEAEGGSWNYDAENRGSFGRAGPGRLPEPRAFAPDALTREVIALVEERFAEHPGRLKHFNWPVTPGDAEAALEAFIEQRLPDFGTYQDALWMDEPFLYHSLLSSSLNLKLLDPRRAVAAAEQAYREGRAPLASVEGFVRQILGWREYVRGVYWLLMPDYLERNHLNAREPLPEFYWTGETDCTCLRQTLRQTLDHGYAHHIQRLMITGLYALLLGVEPRQVHAWYLAVYVDAVEWVELPNTLGMSQYGDGGVMASKPYVATGKYIDKMSNYCRNCRFDPGKRTGPDACPFTTLYWDFLERHAGELRGNRRMALQVRNLDRIDDEERRAIREQAAAIRNNPAWRTHNDALSLGV